MFRLAPTMKVIVSGFTSLVCFVSLRDRGTSSSSRFVRVFFCAVDDKDGLASRRRAATSVMHRVDGAGADAVCYRM